MIGISHIETYVHWLRTTLAAMRGRSPLSPHDQRVSVLRKYLQAGQTIQQVRVGGHTLYVDLRDEGVGARLFVDRFYEPAETTFLSRILKPGMVFADVGANLGYFTTLASKAVGRRGKVVAFEPDSHNFALLARNVASNRCANVKLHHVALGAVKGMATLYVSSDNFGDNHLVEARGAGRETRQVPVESFDSLCSTESSPDVIKIDVQGHEFNVIRGMSRLLSSLRNLTVLIEYWPYGIWSAGDNADELFDTFISHGFVAHRLDASGDIHEIQRDSVMRLLDADREICREANYLNLIFRRL